MGGDHATKSLARVGLEDASPALARGAASGPWGSVPPRGIRLVRELLRALMPTLMSATGGGEGGAYISTSQCQDGIGITEGCDRVRRLKSRVARYPSPLRRWRVAGSRGPARGMVVVGNRYRLVCLGADQLLGASAGTWPLELAWHLTPDCPCVLTWEPLDSRGSWVDRTIHSLLLLASLVPPTRWPPRDWRRAIGGMCWYHSMRALCLSMPGATSERIVTSDNVSSDNVS